MKAFLLGLLSLTLLTGTVAARADENVIGPESVPMSPVIGEAEFQAMTRHFDPRVLSGEIRPKVSADRWQVLWTCVAQSYATGLWYYWTSYNPAYSRAVALNACVNVNGYTCSVGCRVGW
jgi:hypothetical protein